MSFWRLQFLPKKWTKQVDLRYHTIKVEFIRSFFGRIYGLTICLRVLPTFKTFQYGFKFGFYFSVSEICFFGMLFFLFEFFGKKLCTRQIENKANKMKESFWYYSLFWICCILKAALKKFFTAQILKKGAKSPS